MLSLEKISNKIMKVRSLISVSWLAQNVLKTKPWKSLSVIHSAMGKKREFIERHIPGSVYFDIDECCNTTSLYPHMLPNDKQFAEYVQHLGMISLQIEKLGLTGVEIV